ncbi:MAG: Gfo/Idh/MocA family oxidoreductase [Candidatus Brocadiia bacterium]
MTDRVRYAVIGCGSVGPVHAHAVAECPDAELVAVCDVVPERADRCAERHGATACYDHEEMLQRQRPDAVSVCTPHHTHADLTCDCLRAGADVLCEKPLAIRPDDIERMLRTARSEGRKLAGVFQHRFDPVTAAMKRAVSEGLFGQLLNAGASIRCYRGPDYYRSGEWRGTWAGEGGAVLINQAIHSIDVMQWLAGPVKSVFGRQTNLRLADCIETEDTASASLEFANGAMGSIEATASSHLDFDAAVHFYGTGGSFRLTTGGRDELEFLRVEEEEAAERVQELLAEAAQEDQSAAMGKACYGTSHGRQIADFVDAVANGHEPTVTGDDARHAVEVVLAVYESARKGRPVELNGAG